MTVAWDELGTVDPTELAEARQQAHHAAQWLTRLARANLPPEPDDSHSNLGWDPAAMTLMSRDVVARGKSYRAGLSLDSLTLLAVEDETVLNRFELDGRSDAEAGAWLDQVCANAGLQPASSARIPYDLPMHAVGGGGRYAHRQWRAGFAELARWFAAGDDILQETRNRYSAIVPGPSMVRCWPHHFDIATLLSLAPGHPETAPSIGIGLSPGDDAYPQPYFYMTPWPTPPVGSLPSLPAPGHWHTEGFVAAIVPAKALVDLPEPRMALRRFIDQTIDLSRRVLAA